MKLVLACDPGLSGGFAILSASGAIVDAGPSQWSNGTDVRTIVIPRPIIDRADDIAIVAIEEPVNFARENMVKSSKAVAISAGQWMGALAQIGLRNQVLVLPHVWQKILMRGAPNTKARAEATVKLLWPGSARYVYGPQGGYLDGVGDALCLSEHIRQRERAALRLA